eukprot:CAMPEP_0172697074 /NCGR_PEP_ID=MMETSP1074-20121228/28494_1 /TAXON_ID=2916 /ORGANISM="Ceratium fusus, Strain PA161109" /LENGTH=58 /DNA_ID=CAMNT_0013517915 /DNA_START=579 /DNA_END=752 /DNA_ORIENTATION=+
MVPTGCPCLTDVTGRSTTQGAGRLKSKSMAEKALVNGCSPLQATPLNEQPSSKPSSAW